MPPTVPMTLIVTSFWRIEANPARSRITSTDSSTACPAMTRAPTIEPSRATASASIGYSRSAVHTDGSVHDHLSLRQNEHGGVVHIAIERECGAAVHRQAVKMEFAVRWQIQSGIIRYHHIAKAPVAADIEGLRLQGCGT